MPGKVLGLLKSMLNILLACFHKACKQGDIVPIEVSRTYIDAENRSVFNKQNPVSVVNQSAGGIDGFPSDTVTLRYGIVRIIFKYSELNQSTQEEYKYQGDDNLDDAE